MKKVFYSIITICLFAVIYTTANAQFTNNGLGIQEQLIFKTDPIYPDSNQEITVSIESFSTDLNKQNITWYVNGVKKSSGLGILEQKVTTGDPGTKTVVSVVVNKQTGGIIEKSISIKPSYLDIVEEATTYVPPFYKGKALATNQSNYTLVAVSDFRDNSGRKIPDSEITYTWKINGKIDQKKSGAGKNTYTYINNLLSKQIKIDLTASPIYLNESKRIIKNFDFIEPKILFYEDHPTFGLILEREIPNKINLSATEIDVLAVPYFFEKISLPLLTNEWFVNGDKIENNNTNSITLRRIDDEAGQTSVILRINNPIFIRQNSTSGFNIVYK